MRDKILRYASFFHLKKDLAIQFWRAGDAGGHHDGGQRRIAHPGRAQQRDLVSDYVTGNDDLFFTPSSVDLNTYTFEGSLSGPVPFYRNMRFFISGRRAESDGHLFGIREHLPSDSANFNASPWYYEIQGKSQPVRGRRRARPHLRRRPRPPPRPLAAHPPRLRLRRLRPPDPDALVYDGFGFLTPSA